MPTPSREEFLSHWGLLLTAKMLEVLVDKYDLPDPYRLQLTEDLLTVIYDALGTSLQ